MYVYVYVRRRARWITAVNEQPPRYPVQPSTENIVISTHSTTHNNAEAPRLPPCFPQHLYPVVTAVPVFSPSLRARRNECTFRCHSCTLRTSLLLSSVVIPPVRFCFSTRPSHLCADGSIEQYRSSSRAPPATTAAHIYGSTHLMFKR